MFPMLIPQVLRIKRPYYQGGHDDIDTQFPPKIRRFCSMVLDSQSLSIEGIVHWADKLRRISAGEAPLEGAAKDGRLSLPPGRL